MADFIDEIGHGFNGSPKVLVLITGILLNAESQNMNLNQIVLNEAYDRRARALSIEFHPSSQNVNCNNSNKYVMK